MPRPDTSPKANIQSDDSSPAPFVFKSTQSGMVKSDKKCRKVKTYNTIIKITSLYLIKNISRSMELTKKSFGAHSANGKRPVEDLLKSQNFINSIHLNVIIKQQAKMSFLEIWLLVELSVLYVHYLFKIFIKI